MMKTEPDRKSKDPGDEAYLRVLRPLVETYFAFLGKNDPHVRSLGLTPSQFDVMATLGDTDGMTCKVLSEKTLVTKGTLTGVLDRLEAKGLIARAPSREDRRSAVIRLTPKGKKKFEEAFPKHIYFMKPFFDGILTPNQMEALRALLLQLKEGFEKEPQRRKQ